MNDKIQISKKQKEIFDLVADPTITELTFGGSAGGASVYGQEVKTPFGFKKVEDLKIGDQISNVDGGVSRVIDIPYEGNDPAYRFTFADGSQTEVSERHIWKYKLARNQKRKHLDDWSLGRTCDLIEKMKTNHVLIPLCKPVEFTRCFKGEEIDPYLLGVILGDGGISGQNIVITTPDKEIIERCRKNTNVEIRQRNEITYGLIDATTERELLKKWGLMGKKSGEKFVPERYKFGSIDKRIAILQGLIDTDGSVDDRGHLSFTSVSEQLAKDVQFIARSLGANATLTKNPAGYKKNGVYVPCQDAYTVYIQHEHKEMFVSLPRKKERIRPYNGGWQPPCKRIVKIEPIGIKPVRCITTSALDGLYLTNDFIVTHNSKTLSMCLIIALYARKYKGTRFFVGRKTLRSLKQSTIHTLLSKVHPLLGLDDTDAIMHWQDMELEYKNGSVVIFGELAYHPADPEFQRFGSLEIDMAFIDEAGEITIQAKNILKSRVGRGVMNEKFGIPGKLILSANPSMNFLRQEYYDPYANLGGGGFQKWQIGEIEVDGKKQPSYRAFLRMGAYDNPFLPQSYIDTLKSLPDMERKRLLEGNWNYADDDDSLFRVGLLEKATTYDAPNEGDVFIGVDLSDQGKDKSVFSLMRNGVLVAQKISKVQMNWDKNSKLPMSRLLTDELVEFAQRNGITQQMASHIAVEVNGVGVGVRDTFRERGWSITEYTATHKSRSENYYQLMLDMDASEVKILDSLDDVDELKRELSAHSFTMNNQIPEVLKKDKIKLVLGHSPDRADSFMIANYCRNWITNPQNDPHRNTNRIAF